LRRELDRWDRERENLRLQEAQEQASNEF